MADANKKDFVYSAKAQTRILFEQASALNPYVAQARYLQGYNVIELMQKKSFAEVLLLLFTGELPDKNKAELFEKLMIALINLGPRHPAIKAAMVAGVSKANTEHLLPIGLSVLGGKQNGALEVEQAVIFFQENIKKSPTQVAEQLSGDRASHTEGEYHLCAGFGSHYGSIDEFSASLMQQLISDEHHKASFPFLHWAKQFSQALAPDNMGILITGLAGAVFCELSIKAREAIGLFQLICAPGVFAHGVEQTHKPITAMPMLSDEQHRYTSSS